MKPISTLLILLIYPFSSGLTNDSPEPHEIYVFWGLQVNAIVNKTVVPVVSADQKRIHVETPKGIKKIRFSSNFRYSRKLNTTTRLIDVSDYEFKLDYQRRYELEAEAIGQAMRNESLTELEIAKLSGSGGGGSQRQIEALTDNQDNIEENLQSNIENEHYDSETLRDSVNARMILQAPVDIENAYCVITMQYRGPDPESIKRSRAISIGRIRSVGTLMADTPTKVNMFFRIPEGYLRDFKYQFHLLSGESTNWGTTITDGIRKLNESEIAKLRELQNS